jgi:hypothetical protein
MKNVLGTSVTFEVPTAVIMKINCYILGQVAMLFGRYVPILEEYANPIFLVGEYGSRKFLRNIDN